MATNTYSTRNVAVSAAVSPCALLEQGKLPAQKEILRDHGGA
jgi:hypothetical protein